MIGGGLAGTCAALAAARNGAKTVLVQDRPVLGGNASSEIRVNVNGAEFIRPEGRPERETGIIEEILIENRFMNPQESYSVWDHVIYDIATRQPNLEVMPGWSRSLSKRWKQQPSGSASRKPMDIPRPSCSKSGVMNETANLLQDKKPMHRRGIS